MKKIPYSPYHIRPAILVTGAKGQLGKKIIDLLGDEYKLILTDSEEMDITDELKVHKVIKSEKPDVIIHGAAYTRVDDAEEFVEICRKVNALGSKNLALASKELDIPLIAISTDFVFDGEEKTPYVETDVPHPLSVYGQTKLEGENFIKKICDKYYILRTSWLFGELPENHPGTNFVETMLRLAKEKDSLSIVDDQIGSPTYTGDLVKAIRQIISNCDTRHTKYNIPSGIYHFSGNGACSWYDFAKEIFKQSNVEIDVKPVASGAFPQKAKRPPYSYMDKTKIEKALHLKVRPWQEMLRDYLSNRSTTNVRIQRKY